MSGYVLGLTLDRLPVQHQPTLIVALVLADVANQRGEDVFPSIRLVASLARCSPRSAQYAIRDLEEIGYLILVKKGGGRGNPSRYRIDLDFLERQPSRISLIRAAKNNDAQLAQYQETVHDEFRDNQFTEKKRQEPCKNGAQAVAPEPDNRVPKEPLHAVEASRAEPVDQFLEAAGFPTILTARRVALSQDIGDASTEQARFAGIVFSRAFENGVASNPTALARALCRKASRGQMGDPKSVLKTAKNVKARSLEQRRSEFAGKSFQSRTNGSIFRVHENGKNIYVFDGDGQGKGTDVLSEEFIVAFEHGQLLPISDRNIPLIVLDFDERGAAKGRDHFSP